LAVAAPLAKGPRVALVVTTYERPDALGAVLASVAIQTRAPDEILIADDGSGPQTEAVVEHWRAQLPSPVVYVRQSKQGFRLARLRNLAAAATDCEYMVYIDGDMLLERRFVADHCAAARTRCFTQGVRAPLDAAATAAAIASPQRPIGPWSRGLNGLRRLYALHAPPLQTLLAPLGNLVIAIKGCNQGFWRKDLVAVNGFNEAIEGWGPEDKELCARLTNSGIQRRTLWFGGIAFHLDHPPASRQRRAENAEVLRQTLASGATRCALGLDSHSTVGRSDSP